MPTGQIIKALSGFYYVLADGNIYQTRGRGVFRKRGQTPLVGDLVEFESTSQTDGMIVTLLPRKNSLIRPTVANIDVAVIVMSAVEPNFSTHLVDRFLVYLEAKQIQPVIVITKMDLLTEQEAQTIQQFKHQYEQIGYRVWLSQELFAQEDGFLATLQNQLVVFMGQSGVGKSTLLNHFVPELQLETGVISTALGRGKHTTRHVELHCIKGVWIADTPGFSSVELMGITKEELPHLFPEFRLYDSMCKFRECSHTHEPSCGVKEALENGKIIPSRYEHYQLFLEEINQQKPKYEQRKGE